MLTMRFRCPSCGFAGQVRVPPHFPRGRSARLRCGHCQHAFTLAVGRLWPQDSAAAYDALVPGSLDCAGERLGSLWVEITGPRGGAPPVVALQAHPAFSHEVMHDLLDSFREYFPVCYLEFPGSKRNPAAVADEDLLKPLAAGLDLIRLKLKATRVHLLGHLDSCRLALRLAQARPRDVSSLILLDPLLAGDSTGTLEREPAGEPAGKPLAEKLSEAVRLLAGERWGLPQPDAHVRGLARLLSPGLTAEAYRRGERAMRHASPYRRISRLRQPVLVFSSRDGARASRADAQYLVSSIPAAELAPLEKGGGMAAWSGGSWFANKLLSFKRNAEGNSQTRRRRATPSGQPLGWMIPLFVLLTLGLRAGLSLLTLKPAFMQMVLPPLLGSLLPLLWFLLPRGLNPFVLLRLRAFRARTVLLPTLIGALLGAAFFSLQASGWSWRPPAFPPLPGLFDSLPLGHPGQPYLTLARLAAALFVFGLVQNLGLVRRGRASAMWAILLFLLVPPSWPDALWVLPAAAASALLFAGELSVYAPFFLLVGEFFGSELPAAYLPMKAALQGAQGWVLALALLVGAAFLTALELTWKKGFDLETLHFSNSLNKAGRSYRWQPAGGLVLVIFTLLGAAAMVFGFLRL
jgi:pimeloyl-ACP methyl ester carboxylesterase